MIDLSPLNEFVRQTPFRMETAASMLLSVRGGDFLASLDLKDAYFQIPVHQSSRKWLCFVSDRMVHQGTLLRTVNRPTSLHESLCSSVGLGKFRLLQYLDDWLVLASSETRARQHIRELLSLCHSLGTVINEEKSDLIPSQSVEYLGVDHRHGGCPSFPHPSTGREVPLSSETAPDMFRELQTLPPSFDRCCWDTCHRWRNWYLMGDSGCAHCSGT